MILYHNSQDLSYRSPFGAVPTGSSVKISIRVTSDVVPDYVKLRMWRGGEEHIYNMKRTPVDNDVIMYTAVVEMPEKPMLVWYYFIACFEGQVYYYSNNDEMLGGVGLTAMYPTEKSYQITVYKKGFKTPDWFKRGIMYQIFPDRFYGVHNEPIAKKREEYIIHEDWYDNICFNPHRYENGPACNDFFGGNLKGITEKLPYLSELGVSIIYLNPIFEAYSNHRYDTANYKEIDQTLGTAEDFKELCKKAKGYGIRIILDGVFSHTGSDSIYFNKYGCYGENTGAYRDLNSPYRSWYDFAGESNEYRSWWGCSNLPNVNEMTPSYLDYILRDDDSVIKMWLENGASGWRLDVADELPSDFIKILREEVKKTDPDAVIIGEVWEDASNKISYSELREYLLGSELDTVMNYPFKDNMISFVLGNINAEWFSKNIMSIIENYPLETTYALMNILGTHDTMRIKSVLGEVYENDSAPHEHHNIKLTPNQETLALKRMSLIVLMQMTFVGVPCIYYGDEIGMEGISDPFNRMPYTWRCINPELLEYYKELCSFRNKRECLKSGKFKALYAQNNVYVYARYISGHRDAFGKRADNDVVICAVNRGNYCEAVEVDVSEFYVNRFNVKFTNEKITTVEAENGKLKINLTPMSAMVFTK